MGRQFWAWVGVFLAISFSLTLLEDFGVLPQYVTPERPVLLGLYWLVVLFNAYVMFTKIGWPIIKKSKYRQ